MALSKPDFDTDVDTVPFDLNAAKSLNIYLIQPISDFTPLFSHEAN